MTNQVTENAPKKRTAKKDINELKTRLYRIEKTLEDLMKIIDEKMVQMNQNINDLTKDQDSTVIEIHLMEPRQRKKRTIDDL